MRNLFILFAPLILMGCEAPLTLDGLDVTEKQSVRRTDIFMSAIDSDTTTVAVGSEGIILHAAKGTDKWQRHQISAKPSLIEITLCPNGTFAALSMEGDVWTAKENLSEWVNHPLGTPEVPQAIDCDQHNTLWVVGSFSTILSSDDVGKSWKDSSLGEDVILSTVEFVDQDNGFITGEFGTVLITNDRGQTWNFADPVPNDFSPLTSTFRDSSVGWIAGLSGIIYETHDGGQSWNKETTNTTAPLFGMTMMGDYIIAVGDYGTVIQKKIGNADEWTPMELPVQSRFFFKLTEAVNQEKFLVGGAGMLSLINLNESN